MIMELLGRRIYIDGSADTEGNEDKLKYAHSLLSQLSFALASEGCTFVIPFGAEPFLKGRNEGSSIVFDWTVAEVVCRALRDGRAQPFSSSGRLIATFSTSKTEEQIPRNRRPIYDELRERNAISMEF